MSGILTKRQAWPIVGAAVSVVAGLAWFMTTLDDRPDRPEAGLVTVRTLATPSAVPAVEADAGASLTPPAPPRLTDVVAAAPDAFTGDWLASDGQRLSVHVEGDGHFRVAMGDEVYDGVAKNGRIHFPLGIDGEWLQAAQTGPCLYLGSGKRYCRP